jgi:gamma-glutamylcyclotransferase (GGCT)/AIG2-like uncharacterized protein YtfP
MTATPKAAPDRIYLFCYGTLKRGEPGHELMSGATFVGTVKVDHLCWIRDAEYPSCIETTSAADTVVGEIWDVPLSDLPIINEYEGKNYRLVKLKDSNLHAYLLKENESDRFVETT